MTARILCVDDDPNVLSAYRMLHGQPGPSGERFQIEVAPDGEQGLQAAAERGPYAVILSDMAMPGMDGIQFLRQVRQLNPLSVRMMLTGYAQLQVAIDAVNEGHIFRFLTKPCSPRSLLQALAAGVCQYRLLVAEKDILEKTLAASIKALTDVLSLVNPAAFGRAVRVRRLVQLLAAALGVADAWQLEVAAMLSQTGCVTLPERLVEKVYRGVELSQEEAALYAAHPKFGHDLIAIIPRLESVAEIIAYQDKCFDGSGSPANDRRGASIPLGARILKVALDYDSLESAELSRATALARMRQRLGRYDPAILDALQEIEGSDPPFATQEVPIQSLLGRLETIQGCRDRGEDNETRDRVKPGYLILAEDVWSRSGILLLSKGQELTPHLLQRLRNFAQSKSIQETIRVRMPVA